AEERVGITYLFEEHTRQIEAIDYWEVMAKDIQCRYGRNVKFLVYSARFEHVARIQRVGLKAFHAKTSVLSESSRWLSA
ncbi:PBSX family phage terminase large subunit, partial [Lactiplantibacillus plantarum]